MTTLWNEQPVYLLVEEAERILSNVALAQQLINDEQALRLFDITVAVAAANISDSGKKSFFCLLQSASLQSSKATIRSIYDRLIAEFIEACSPLLDDSISPSTSEPSYAA